MWLTGFDFHMAAIYVDIDKNYYKKYKPLYLHSFLIQDNCMTRPTPSADATTSQ